MLVKSVLTCTAAAVAILLTCSVNCEELPEYLLICHRNDSNLNECMKKSIEKLKPHLTRGIPEYDIPGLEPIMLGDLIVAESVQGSNQGLSITAKDIKAYGASNYIMKRMNVVEYAKTYTFELELPHLYVTGKYNVDGRILFLPVRGQGKFTGNFTGGSGNVRIRGERQTIDGKPHMIVTKLDIKIKVQNGRLNLDNLFGGDKVLGDIINQTINQNFNLLSQELIPLIEKSLSRIFKRTGNKILERFTEEQLFP